MPNENHLMGWLTLYHAPSISPWQLFQLWTEHRHPSCIIEHLLSLPTLPEKTRQALLQPPTKTITEQINWQQHKNHYIITLNSPYYPPPLKFVHTPPPVLFLKGNPNVLTESQVAVVGSRKASPIGLKNAHRLALNLSQQDLIITSGLALGIDTAAHYGAIAANKPTIAILGTGVEITYPKKNTQLAETIIEQGALVSEFGLHAPPLKTHFPRRNRVISGLSLATLVIEANLRSGSLITAQYALEQGRDVFAVPGSISHPQSRGTHYLIKNGANLTESYSDVLKILNIEEKPRHCAQNEVSKLPELDKQHYNLLECVDFCVTSYQVIYSLSKLTTEKVTLMLLDLELNGYIKKVAGGLIRVK